MSELKPCPFCGGDNVHKVSVCCLGHSSRWAIVCCDCSARVERSTKQKAINAWNRRATEDGLNDEIAELYETISSFYDGLD